ncbi:hypothetical protein U3516DRAFT_754044 [Neocallimastix sp. 'constans']
MSKYATSICASQFAFTAIIKKTKASPRIQELRNRNGFTEYNFHQTKFEFFKDVLEKFLSIPKTEQHNKNIYSSGGIFDKEIQHLIFRNNQEDSAIFNSTSIENTSFTSMKYLYQYISYNIKDDILIDIQIL